MDPLPNAARRPTTKPAGHYGTIKLVGVTAEELMEKYGYEDDTTPTTPQAPKRTRGTVEDIAGLMQTSQRAQNKGKQSFWEKISSNKKKKAEEKKQPKVKPTKGKHPLFFKKFFGFCRTLFTVFDRFFFSFFLFFVFYLFLRFFSSFLVFVVTLFFK